MAIKSFGVLIFSMVILFACDTASKEQETSSVQVYLKNRSTVDSCICIIVELNDSYNELGQVCVVQIEENWDKLRSERFPHGLLDVSIGLKGDTLRKDTSVNLSFDIDLFITFRNDPIPSRYGNDEVYEYIAKNNLEVDNLKLFIDSLYQNNIIEYNPSYEKVLMVQVIEKSPATNSSNAVEGHDNGKP